MLKIIFYDGWHKDIFINITYSNIFFNLKVHLLLLILKDIFSWAPKRLCSPALRLLSQVEGWALPTCVTVGKQRAMRPPPWPQRLLLCPWWPPPPQAAPLLMAAECTQPSKTFLHLPQKKNYGVLLKMAEKLACLLYSPSIA